MGLDFGGLPARQEADVQPYDIAADRRETGRRLVNSAEVDALAGTIKVDNMATIVTFGAKAAEEISRASDVMLRGMNVSQLDQSGGMLNTLAGIMSKFDLDEITEVPGRFGKLFGNPRKRTDKLLAKYHTMGEEVDRIYVQLKTYESELMQSNRNLNRMFEANVNTYHELIKYILAGEQGCREIREQIVRREADMAATGDPAIQFELTTLRYALNILEQRTQDLRVAETVAMQTIPMLKTMEFNNMSLVRKIDSAFLITLPVFRQALAQAIMLKRQRIQAESLAALDAKANEMLARNARDAARQTQTAVRPASGGPAQAENLENAWRTIVNGIDETKAIREDALRQREDDRKRLEAIKREFRQRYHSPDAPHAAT